MITIFTDPKNYECITDRSIADSLFSRILSWLSLIFCIFSYLILKTAKVVGVLRWWSVWTPFFADPKCKQCFHRSNYDLRNESNFFLRLIEVSFNLYLSDGVTLVLIGKNNWGYFCINQPDIIIVTTYVSLLRKKL